MAHSLPATIPEGRCRSLKTSSPTRDRVAGVRAALVAADEVRALREQIDDLALALVSPLRSDDDGRRHGGSLPALSRAVTLSRGLRALE